MPAIETCSLPADAFLQRYLREGHYADCYITAITGDAGLAQYVEAFYTTALFKAERVVLAMIGRSSTDHQARQLGAGARDRFAAWAVEQRDDRQILLRDFSGHTCSWLMAAPIPGGGTQLYFGSAVVASADPRTGRSSIGTRWQVLLGLHKLYSRMLLRAASRRLMAGDR
ncbi:hypothetical protein [Agrilutibacter solisilvae]|uniref:DUF2867 domain-containing protein n=1 Tax=Agrilutibacter solisilvae TaxID=2763317 RepID=A0A975ASE7_9GAMM|nr:hypothetical protein [Lysobacter solisilvae]QSX77890.1 hypothetical protein I8J32_014345 [Lysobacter solisilvae]